MGKAVLLRLVEGAQNRGKVGPGIGEFGIVLIVYVDFQADGAGKIVSRITRHKFHRFSGSGIGIGKTLGYAGIAITCAEAICQQFLVPQFQKPAVAGKDFPQIRVNAFNVWGQIFRYRPIS